MAEGSSIATGLNPLTDPIALFIIQLLLIVIISRVLGYLLNYVKQPPVISEVITGIILGPSVLGQSATWSKSVFPPTSIPIINVFANIGLIFFMFLIGLEIDATILQKNLKASLIISLTSIVVPFAMGVGLAALIHEYLPPAATHISFGLFLVFVGVAISITAFPVLARILNERNLMRTKVGVSSLAAASVDDVIAWILLAIVVAYGNNAKNGTSGTTLGPLWTFLMLIGFIAFCFVVVKRGLDYLYKRYVKTEFHKHQFLILLLILALSAAFYTQVIGVHAIFGAFLLGICSPRIDGFHIYITERIEDIITIILLPLYFTFSGLRTQLKSINSGTAGGLTIFIIFVACIGKIGGATFASRFCKKSWRESLTIGFLMNTKGLVELIVLNIGLDIGVLSTQTFTMFVIMALVTTFMTTPVVHYLWIVHSEKENFVPMASKEQGSFNIILYISNTRIGSAMTHIAAAITPKTSGSIAFKVKSLFPTNNSDRPSSYFFSHYFMTHIPPNKKEQYNLIQEEATNVGLEFKPVFINTNNNVADDLSSISKSICPDIVLIGYSTEEQVNNNTITPLSKSVGGGEDSFYIRPISKTLQTCKSCIGIVVDKGLERFNRQHNLLFAYNGEDCESDALNIVCKMSKRTNIKITILTNNKDKLTKNIELTQETSLQSFNIVESENPFKELVEKSSLTDSEYWMAVVGIAREDSTKQERIINSTQVSLLIIHPSNQLLDSTLKSSIVQHNNNNNDNFTGDNMAIELNEK